LEKVLFRSNRKTDVIWFDVEEVDLTEEFINLFSKPTPKPLAAKQKKHNSPTKEFTKLLDSKRSHSIGILMSSQHLDASVIRQALMEFDNKILSSETLTSIYSIRPTDDEIKTLNQYLMLNKENTLDRPELFLLELSRIPAFDERIYCLVYQNCFNESITSIGFRLNSIKTICEDLVNSKKIKKLLGLADTIGFFSLLGWILRGIFISLVKVSFWLAAIR
jgi:hypothetical protein